MSDTLIIIIIWKNFKHCPQQERPFIITALKTNDKNWILSNIEKQFPNW
jgi:hypothetical protein